VKIKKETNSIYHIFLNKNKYYNLSKKLPII